MSKKINFTPSQEKAVNHFDSDLIVSAGAGSGKTLVLVERYLTILKRKLASPGQIVAITYTRKAAQEMKYRLMDKIAALRQTACDKYWDEMYEQMYFSQVNTIHGFCTSILKEFPIEAGVDPGFEILEELESDLLLQKSVEKVLNENESVSPYLTIFYSSRLPVLLKEFYKKYRDAAGSPEDLDFSGETDLAQKWLELQDSVRRLLSASCDIPESVTKTAIANLAGKWSDYEKYIPELVKKDSIPQILDILLEMRLSRQCPERIKPFITELSEKAGEFFSAVILQKMPEMKKDFLLLAEKAGKVFQAEKDKNGWLDFSDLMRITLEMLRNRHDTRRKIQERYSYFLIDEFQDTNRVQKEMLDLIIGGRYGQGRLFIVGDPKQSIYRFRGADVDVFYETKEEILSRGGEYIPLNDNFRSVPRLVDAYNHYFSGLFEKNEYEDMTVHRIEQQELNERIEILYYSADQENAAARRRIEAATIAARILRLVREEEFCLEDKKTVQWRDIVLLFNTMSNVHLYEKALLTRGIPYYIVNGRGFYQQQEIVDVINLLKVLSNVYDAAALTGILRSPMFAIDDCVLYKLRSACRSVPGFICTSRQANGLSARQEAAVKRASSILEELLALREKLPPAELLLEGVLRTGYFEFLAGQAQGRASTANLEKLFALVRRFTKKGILTLHELSIYLQDLYWQESRESNAQVDMENSNVVRIMTVHQAKGLEFPIIVLPDLYAQKNTFLPEITWHDRFGAGMALGWNEQRIEDNVYKRIKETHQKAEYDEYKRLLYVAMTRAREYLILPLMDTQPRTKRMENTWGNYICHPAILNAAKAITVQEEQKPAPQELRNKQEGKGPGGNLRPPPPIIFPIALPEEKTDGQHFSVTDILNYAFCPRRYYQQRFNRMYDFPQPANERDELPRLKVGQIIHWLSAHHELPESAAAKEAANMLTETDPIAKRLWDNFLSVYDEMESRRKKNSQRLVEKEFVFCVKDQIIKGKWDLNIIGDDFCHIIDYKTADPKKLTKTQKDLYRMQMEIYAFAASVIWPQKTISSELIYLFDLHRIRTSYDSNDLLRIKGDLEDILSVMSGADASEFLFRLDNCPLCPMNGLCLHSKN